MSTPGCGLPGVYAAGDGTNTPSSTVGSVRSRPAQVAEEIAARAGASLEPAPFHPVIRGKLITGDESLNLQADIAGGAGRASRASTTWWPPQKIAGKYLSAQLSGAYSA